MSSEHAIDALTDDERRLMEAVDATLEREMAVEPSADFASRVRARIGAEDRERGWGFPWALAAAAVLAIATGILFATLRDTPEKTGPPALNVGHDVALPAQSGPDPLEAPSSTPDVRSTRALPATAPAAAVASSTRGAGLIAASEPEVLVPDDLRLAIERVMAMGRAATVNQRPFPVDLTIAPIAESAEPVAMVVEELQVPPINPPAGGVEKGFGY